MFIIMKNILFILIIGLLAFAGCDDDKYQSPSPLPTTGNITFVINNTIDGGSIPIGAMNNVNEAGNTYSVDELKYYLSNFVLIKDDGSEFKSSNYELIDEESSASKYFTLENVPFGNYTGLRFFMGVDSTKNHSGVHTGDLDPINGMIWDWSTGYIYFKHEGMFIDSTGTTDYLTYHLGTLNALVTEEIPINLNFTSGVKIVKMSFNLNKVYRSPNMINFNGENIHQSLGPGENVWIQLIRENFQGAFEITSIQ